MTFRLGTAAFAATLLSFMAAPSLAQYDPQSFPIDLAFGVGAVKDTSPSQVLPTVVATFGWDWDEKWWGILVVETELGSLSDAEPCQLSPAEPPNGCDDIAILGGFRFRPVPHTASGFRPFANVLVGQYSKGSGIEDVPSSNHFAAQLGGGLEFRWPGSFQGVRASFDYRRVWAGNADRNQFRYLAHYVIGPRRFTRQP